MAQFNLNDYETVEERIARFYKDNPNGRIVTKDLTTKQDRQVSTWRVKAEIWLPNVVRLADDRFADDWMLKATGLAFEVDGVNGMANKTSALENCETSAIGRALANAGYSGNKRTSREEMEKVERGVTPKPAFSRAVVRDWVGELDRVGNTDAARRLYMEAQKAQAGQAVLDAITAKAKTLG